MQFSLFNDRVTPKRVLVEGAVVLPGAGQVLDSPIMAILDDVQTTAPFRNMITPGGHRMSVGMTNCGSFGWVADKSGYRYCPTDPTTGQPWPVMPEPFQRLAHSAAHAAGYPGFAPDSCLINRYLPGAKLSLHQDKDEADYRHPIVSVSLGLPATFLFGGLDRKDPTQKIPLRHGDIVVWGGASRLSFHGVRALKQGTHALMGTQRINLTFRKAV